METAVRRGFQVLGSSSSSSFLGKNIHKTSFAATYLPAARKRHAPGYFRTAIQAQQRPTWLPGLDPPHYLDGTLAGDYGFDPLGLGEDPRSLKWYVQAELIHARFAMAAVAGILLTDLLRVTGISNLPVWYEAGATKFDFASTRTLFIVQLLLMGFVEIKRYMDFTTPGSQAKEGSFFGLEASLEGLEPGYVLDMPLGLVARYAIGRLYRPPKTDTEEDISVNAGEQQSKGTVGNLLPINFITVATPHLGSRGNKQVPFLFGVTAFEKVAAGVIHWIFRRTGRHLFLTDNDDGKPPLLKRMVEDHYECNFMSALRSFKRRVAYSNVGYDHIVGWRTSSIRLNIELPKWEDSANEKYPHIVYEELCKASDTEQGDSILAEDDSLDNLEEELVTGLSRVSWEKVDVSFHSSRLRFAAHSVIQVKDPYMHSEGADVIQHIIDHFIV